MLRISERARKGLSMTAAMMVGMALAPSGAIAEGFKEVLIVNDLLPVQVTNLPAVQTVDGAVDVNGRVEVTNPELDVRVSNLPKTQNVNGTVAVSNFPDTIDVGNLPTSTTIDGPVTIGNVDELAAAIAAAIAAGEPAPDPEPEPDPAGTRVAIFDVPQTNEQPPVVLTEDLGASITDMYVAIRPDPAVAAEALTLTFFSPAGELLLRETVTHGNEPIETSVNLFATATSVGRITAECPSCTATVELYSGQTSGELSDASVVYELPNTGETGFAEIVDDAAVTVTDIIVEITPDPARAADGPAVIELYAPDGTLLVTESITYGTETVLVRRAIDLAGLDVGRIRAECSACTGRLGLVTTEG